jgi:hypothetical protein
MKETYYANWNSVLMFVLAAALLLIYGYNKYGLSHSILIGALGEVCCTLWLVWERYTTYVSIQDKRWVINSKQQLFPDVHIDITSILYIARMHHFAFRSWGGRMVMFFRDETGRVRQTTLPESLYSWDNLQNILRRLTSIKPAIEIDSQYRLLMSKRDPLDANLSQQLPRTVKEIEAYVASKYGPP